MKKPLPCPSARPDDHAELRRVFEWLVQAVIWNDLYNTTDPALAAACRDIDTDALENATVLLKDDALNERERLMGARRAA